MESGKVTLNRQPTDINKIIQSVADTQESVARAKGLYLKVSLDPHIPLLSFDQDKIIQVLNNLINNALKFTDTGGITVSSLINAGKHQVEVRVQDTGCGIKEEDLTKLFEKFQQLGEAHQRQAGTGLGLAICKEIIRQHGGKVGVESKKAKEAVFILFFPLNK